MPKNGVIEQLKSVINSIEKGEAELIEHTSNLKFLGDNTPAEMTIAFSLAFDGCEVEASYAEDDDGNGLLAVAEHKGTQ